MTERGVEEVAAAAKSAGLKMNPKKWPVQVMKFSSGLNTVDYRLLELPPQLEDSLQTGETLVVRGQIQEEAVLCSQTATYEMKVVDVSNTMLICPRLRTPEDSSFKEQKMEDVIRHLDVCATIGSYYEVRPCRPRLAKLKQILQTSAYKGPELEELSTRLYSLEDLLDSVQASEKELLTALQQFGAFELNGKWRILEVQYEEGAFTSILTLLDEKMWSYKSVPLGECCMLLEELYPRFVVKHCLELYGQKCTSEDDVDDIYCFDELKVCQFYAEYLLRPAGRFNIDDFLESWQQSVPSGMQTSLQQLMGLALWDLDARPPVIWHFPARDLPEDSTERFARLFKTRTKWTLEEIEPFIRDLATEKISANAVLLKYARMSTNGLGKKVFNSKRPL
ncbi:sister chromatid cohesion protein DCC1-like isoform X2 [Corticium candelabrum]|uniref:sister chromatid cohesion protein DCC1-like isoform X2 n=1 Tax=Corticium candelabrum TaxID=121492 RepID=UPI002E26AC6D|nr:sister chromatid cohesion protein DCC1-like isoform X2 [Corticium candelabrum]